MLKLFFKNTLVGMIMLNNLQPKPINLNKKKNQVGKKKMKNKIMILTSKEFMKNSTNISLIQMTIPWKTKETLLTTKTIKMMVKMMIMPKKKYQMI